MRGTRGIGEYLELLADVDDGSCVRELLTVVGGREDGEQLATSHELVAVLHNLEMIRE